MGDYKPFSFNRSLSEKAARTVDARLKHCWSNAHLALRRVAELKEARYVEGWLMREALPVPFEHGWLERGGEIIDPTRVLWHEDTADVLYFPAVRYTLSELQAALRKPADLPLVHRFGRGGLNHPAYAQAYTDTLKRSILQLSRIIAPIVRDSHG